MDKELAAAIHNADLTRGEGEEALTLEADVCDTELVDKTVALAREHFGKIVVLHNNVSIAPTVRPSDIDDTPCQKTMNIAV